MATSKRHLINNCLFLKMKLSMFNHLFLLLIILVIFKIIGILKRFYASSLFSSGKTRSTYTTPHIFVFVFFSLPLYLSLSLSHTYTQIFCLYASHAILFSLSSLCARLENRKQAVLRTTCRLNYDLL